jgi:hypothetical protein
LQAILRIDTITAPIVAVMSSSSFKLSSDCGLAVLAIACQRLGARHDITARKGGESRKDPWRPAIAWQEVILRYISTAHLGVF